jgi:hypothetical protein
VSSSFCFEALIFLKLSLSVVFAEDDAIGQDLLQPLSINAKSHQDGVLQKGSIRIQSYNL